MNPLIVDSWLQEGPSYIIASSNRSVVVGPKDGAIKLTSAEARELAEMLMAAADRADCVEPKKG